MINAVVALPEADGLAGLIAGRLGCAHHLAGLHEFPDGETSVRINPATGEGTVLVVASLARPNPGIIPLLFLARLLREYGAAEIFLVAPYLAYMRQDKRFREGEGISARYFAELLSAYFDGLVTVDPHLHRIKSLAEIYTIPALNADAAPAISEWLGDSVDKPLLIGPDSESEQWAGEVARRTDAPMVVLEKKRSGDRNVEVSLPDVSRWRTHTPVLVDDIISTGRSMIAAIKHLQSLEMNPPVCIGVHGIFADDAETALMNAGAGRIVTTNTVPHTTNGIDISPAVCEAISHVMKIETP